VIVPARKLSVCSGITFSYADVGVRGPILPITREVRCERCGTLNRLRAYSFRQVPNCGKCHQPLPESATIKGLRDIYLWRKPLAIVALLAIPGLLAAWLLSGPHYSAASVTTPLATRTNVCTAQTQPHEGIFRWYGPYWGQDIADLTITTSSGSNYFIKLVDGYGRTARSYFLHGGSMGQFPVPLGTYTLKYATGTSWCSEEEYFGADTVFNEADKLLDFDQTVRQDTDGTTTSASSITVELIRQSNGNLPTHRISKADFK
jgi:hypothetical protein